jgi:hypothetical protein
MSQITRVLSLSSFLSLSMSSRLRGTVHYFTRHQMATSVSITQTMSPREGRDVASFVTGVACSSSVIFFTAGIKYCECFITVNASVLSRF